MDTQTRNIPHTLAEIIAKQTHDRFIKEGMDWRVHAHNYLVTVKPGNKYTKIDIGTSGKYMIDADGNIFGIKAYGVIHRGHYYGTLDTISQYDWSGYVARKVV